MQHQVPAGRKCAEHSVPAPKPVEAFERVRCANQFALLIDGDTAIDRARIPRGHSAQQVRGNDLRRCVQASPVGCRGDRWIDREQHTAVPSLHPSCWPSTVGEAAGARRIRDQQAVHAQTIGITDFEAAPLFQVGHGLPDDVLYGLVGVILLPLPDRLPLFGRRIARADGTAFIRRARGNQPPTG